MFLKARFDLSYFVKCYDYTETETILMFHGPIVSLCLSDHYIYTKAYNKGNRS